ncbi:MAG TPA: rhodanese-like domain-containing protein [Gammaproteobacteria bacterium]|nr:rhodanese-like domain-containing protein [Gammaproteobacteria bacterium]
MNQKYNCSFVKAVLEEGGQLIDVRSSVEFNQGALSGAVNMPIDKFQFLKDDIDTDKPVLLYCRSGVRSEMVKKYLEQLGFDHVHNIGGYLKFAGC